MRILLELLHLADRIGKDGLEFSPAGLLGEPAGAIAGMDCGMRTAVIGTGMAAYFRRSIDCEIMFLIALMAATLP